MRLWQAMERNIAGERDRWFPWVVVSFAGGIGIYFALKSEPSAGFAILLACAGAGVAVAGTRATHLMVRFACALIAASAIGLAVAKLRTEIVTAPVIQRSTGPVTIEGRIESVFIQDETHARIVIAPIRIDEQAEDLPRRVRLSLRGAS